MEKGLILVNTGPGKGKTTAAVGVAVRALGQGLKVAFLQFVKSQETGESTFLKNYSQENPGQLLYARYGAGFIATPPSPEDISQARQAFLMAEKLLIENYDLVVLDEVCIALNKELIELSEVIRLLTTKPLTSNVILTGRNCPEAILELADTVTEMTVIKHAYEKGISAKKGIEF